ncbi:MAG: cellulase family glycosylhydrolase [Sulfuricurvum sp.]|nr:cellulase family glycosylhydrolase [Sulfuricurvum sp.]
MLSFNCKSETKAAATISSTSVAGTLTVSADGVFMRNGKPYQGIGVNYYDAFVRTIANTSNKTYNAGFKYLSDNKIPFIRFSANGFYPKALQLYQTNRTTYFALLDEFVKSAESYGIGLIPSLFFNLTAVPDLVGEHVNQWGNPNSKTIAFMRTYTSEMVSRYKDSPAIWGWEFGNEYNAFADYLDQSINFLPKVDTANGTPASRTLEDATTTDTFVSAMNEFAKTVKQYDPDRAIFSGNAFPAPNIYHRYVFKNWTQDSSTEYTALLRLQNPSVFGTLTIHPYPYHEFTHFSDFKASLAQMIQESVRSSKELKKALFIGEFGAPETLGATVAAQKFQDLLNAIIDNKVQLAALWVFDFSSQEGTDNVTPTNSRKYMLDAIIKANAQFLLSAGINETVKNNTNCSVYPNPATDVVQLKVDNWSMLDMKSMSYQLYDMQGQLLETKKIESELTNIAISKFAPSIYFMKVIQENKEVKVFKINKD